MALFPKFAKVAGITFKQGIGSREGRQSALALARRGMLGEVMLKKIKLPKDITGKMSGLPWGIQVTAQGRKRVHPLGWMPDELLAKGYGKDILFGAESKASVFYRKQKSRNFGIRYKLPEESKFVGGIQSPDELGKAVGLGLGAIAAGTLLFNFLSKDDTTDKEETPIDSMPNETQYGFPEAGIGPIKRKALTDFGSGYQGSETAQEILQDKTENTRADDVRQRFGVFALSLPSEGVKVGTGHKRILIPKEDISQKDLVNVLGFQPVKIAIPESGQDKTESFRHVDKLYHLHSHEKFWTMHKDEHASSTMLVEKAERQGGGIFRKALEFAKGIPHVISEGIPGAYYWMKGQLTGTEGMVQRILRDMREKYRYTSERVQEGVQFGLKEFNRMVGREQDTIDGIWRQPRTRSKAINQFSGVDDAYNTVQGFSESGIGPESRKIDTDFGSGWDPIRALARQFGMKSKELLRSSELKEALVSGSVIKRLGSGTGSKAVDLMESTYKGQTFRYVRKNISDSSAPTSMLDDFMATMRPGNAQNEINAAVRLNNIGPSVQHDIAPTMYGFTRGKDKAVNSLYQEYIEGSTMKNVMAKGGAKPDIALSEYTSYLKRQGITHGDLSWDNIIMTDKSPTGFSVIDWGFSKIEGLQPSKIAPKITDFSSPWQGPVVSGQMSSGMVAPSPRPPTLPGKAPEGPLQDIMDAIVKRPTHPLEDMFRDVTKAPVPGERPDMSGPPLKDIIDIFKGSTNTVEGGFTPAAPELQHIAAGMTEPASTLISKGISQMSMRDNVPLSVKIRIKGTSNQVGDVANMANMISGNMPQSKVNISTQDYRMHLTPQAISDMIDR